MKKNMFNKKQKYCKYENPPEGNKKEVYECKNRNDLINENIYLRWKVHGLKIYSENINTANDELTKRFEEYKAYVYNKYLNPDIQKLKAEIEKLNSMINTQSIEDLKNINKNLISENSELNKQIEQLKTENSNLALKRHPVKKTNLETKNSKLAAQLSALTSKNEELETEKIHLLIGSTCLILLLILVSILSFLL